MTTAHALIAFLVGCRLLTITPGQIQVVESFDSIAGTVFIGFGLGSFLADRR